MTLAPPKWLYFKVFLFRLGLQLTLFIFGLRVLSVDDYLRVSVAHQVARKWNWFPDPFFLPAYFWIYNLPMRLGLDVLWGSLGLTILISGFGSVFSCKLLERFGLTRRSAVVGALLLSMQPLSLWLGGVPLSETLALLLLLTVFSGWRDSSFLWRTLSVLAGILLPLLRYELWPVSLWIAGLSFRRRDWEGFSGLVGLAVVLTWIFSRSDPLQVFRFSQSSAEGLGYPASRAGLLAWGALAFMPLSTLIGPLVFVPQQRRDSSPGIRTLVGGAMALSALPLVMPLVGYGYYPLVYPVRILLIPMFLLGLLAIPSAMRALEFLPNFSRRFVIGSTGTLLCLLSVRPSIEVKDETVRAAKMLGQTLDRAGDHSIGVQKSDLGWTVLWGLNHGDSRLFFSKEVPDLFERANEMNAECVLTSTISGRKTAELPESKFRATRGESGKYRLYCRQ